MIDVRETDEVIQGNIPSSVNLPMSELESGLKLEPGNFQRKFAFGKPRKDQPIIVYCKAVRPMLVSGIDERRASDRRAQPTTSSKTASRSTSILFC